MLDTAMFMSEISIAMYREMPSERDEGPLASTRYRVIRKIGSFEYTCICRQLLVSASGAGLLYLQLVHACTHSHPELGRSSQPLRYMCLC